MRLIVILSVVLLLFSCGDGGDSPYSSNTGGGASAGGGDTKTEEPAEPERPKASQEAALLANEYKMLTRLREKKEETASAKAAQFDGQDMPADAYYYLGLIHDIAGEHDKAAKAFERFLGGNDLKDPNHPWGLFYLATDLAKIGNPSGAEQYVRQFGNLYKEKQPIKFYRSLLTTLARAYVSAGQLDKAVPHYEEVVELGAADFGLELVQTYWLLRKYDDAKRVADKLVEMNEGKKDLNHYQAFAARAAVLGKPVESIDVYGWVPDDFDVAAQKGKVVLFFTWGMHKLGESKGVQRRLRELRDKLSDKPLQIVGLSQEQDYDPRRLSEGKLDLTPEEELDGIGVWARYPEFKLEGFAFGLLKNEDALRPLGYTPDIKPLNPMYAIVGKDGTLRFFAQGKSPETFTLLEAALDKLLAE